ncbi:MAG: sulfotransferase, partial [Pseudomonadota bacterium]
CFEKIVTIEDGAKARLNYGTTLMELGRPDEAATHLQRAVEMAPDYCAAHRSLSLVRRYKPGDPHIAAMDALATRNGLSLDERAHLAFARAKAFDDVDDRPAAFSAWSEGNRARREELGYDPAKERERFETITRLFRDHALTPLTFEPIPYKPVFIVGMPRSGTSLCEEILARHPAVWGAGELEDIRLAVARAAEANGNRLCHDMVVAIRAQYLEALREIKAPEGVVTDKMPGNFRFVGFMRLAFPEATIIHMKRDPVAVCWSLYRSYFAIRGHRYAYNLEDAGDYTAHYTALMDLYDQIWPGEIHTTIYETLTEDPEAEIRKLLSACGLPFDPACLSAHQTTRAVRTISALQVRKAIYKGSSEAWRRYEPFLTPLLDRLDQHGLLRRESDALSA